MMALPLGAVARDHGSRGAEHRGGDSWRHDHSYDFRNHSGYRHYPFGFIGFGYSPFYYNDYYRPYYDHAYYSPSVYRGREIVAYDHRGSLMVDVQEELADLGYYRGEIDGVIGPMTRNAIRNYQRDRGLPVTGQIDSRLIRSLRID
jgi:N-acetylmuramoyl-L-alanine amidase